MSIDQHELVSATHVTHTSSDAHHVPTSLAASPQNMFRGEAWGNSLHSHVRLTYRTPRARWIQLVQILN